MPEEDEIRLEQLGEQLEVPDQTMEGGRAAHLGGRTGRSVTEAFRSADSARIRFDCWFRRPASEGYVDGSSCSVLRDTPLYSTIFGA
jgi:hypothetical protein